MGAGGHGVWVGSCGRILPSYGGKESVAAAGHRRNELGGPRLLPKHFAQFADTDAQGRLTHHRVGPERLEKLVFSDQTICVCH
jgi:hypothetical protein